MRSMAAREGSALRWSRREPSNPSIDQPKLLAKTS
jgi:hypothetical protein